MRERVRCDGQVVLGRHPHAHLRAPGTDPARLRHQYVVEHYRASQDRALISMRALRAPCPVAVTPWHPLSPLASSTGARVS